MGYRTWISDDMGWGTKVPDFGSCLSSLNEGKRYGLYDDDFFNELAAALSAEMYIVVMGEDGDSCERITISEDGVTVVDLHEVKQ